MTGSASVARVSASAAAAASTLASVVRSSASNAADDARHSLWRAQAAFRVLSACFCLFLDLRFRHANDRPGLALVVVAVIVVWTAITVVAAVRAGTGSTPAIVLDIVVVAGLTLLSLPVQAANQLDGHTPTLTTLWAASPALAAGIRHGWRFGIGAALVQGAASLTVRSGYDGTTLTNIFLLVLAGGLVGYVSTLFVRAQADLAAAGAELALAEAQRAAVAERDRLTRGIHDGVLQVLALVQRRGIEWGGEAGELGRLAGEQERSLRALITDRARPATVGGDVGGAGDLAAGLLTLRSDRVTVSVPAGPVTLPAPVVAETTAAVRAALDNVSRHAGDTARAWVLLDAGDDAVEVVVRDDGVGFGPDRLSAAVADGRLGVSASIVGRIETLGGHARLTSQPNDGVEVTISVPRVDVSTRTGPS